MKFGALHFPDVVVTDGTTDRRNGVLSGAAGSNGISDCLRLFLAEPCLHLRVFLCLQFSHSVTVLRDMTLCNE